MLFQNGVLVDSLSVSENVALALQAAGHDSSAAEVKKYLELVKLDAADMHKMPGQVLHIVHMRKQSHPSMATLYIVFVHVS